MSDLEKAKALLGELATQLRTPAPGAIAEGAKRVQADLLKLKDYAGFKFEDDARAGVIISFETDGNRNIVVHLAFDGSRLTLSRRKDPLRPRTDDDVFPVHGLVFDSGSNEFRGQEPDAAIAPQPGKRMPWRRAIDIIIEQACGLFASAKRPAKDDDE